MVVLCGYVVRARGTKGGQKMVGSIFKRKCGRNYRKRDGVAGDSCRTVLRLLNNSIRMERSWRLSQLPDTEQICHVLFLSTRRGKSGM